MWLWAQGWEKPPLEATEHPGLGDWHPTGAELCQLQALRLKTTVAELSFSPQKRLCP